MDILINVLFIIGLILWCIFYARLWFKFGKQKTEQEITNRIDGILVVENDPDDGLYFFLQIPKDPTEVVKKKYVVFEVDKSGLANRTVR